MKHLKITHILNVSAKIPSFFENSSKRLNLTCLDSLNIRYMRINIEDYDTVQIKMSFPLVYEFIESAFLD